MSLETAAATDLTVLRANKNALHQIILNLCSNALRHTPAGGWVRLSVEHRTTSAQQANGLRGAVAVHVTDSGCGVPAEYLSQLFHGRFSGSGSSPGLGLTVCAPPDAAARWIDFGSQPAGFRQHFYPGVSFAMTPATMLHPSSPLHPAMYPGAFAGALAALPSLSAMRPSVLIADDEPGIRVALAAHLAREGWAVETAGGVREANRCIDREAFDLVVCDVRMADGDGFEVLRATQATADPAAFLFVTAYGSVSQAVEAMQGGAVDYLTKPASFDRLRALAEKVMAARPSAATSAPTCPSGIIGRSRALETALARARAAARTDSDVLVEAESGTGKELLARMIHDASTRRDGPFIAINCAALPESLLESELFGHARGAFTGATNAKAGKFELANGGTLLLDEIGDMPLNLQPKLLRVLQERVVERLGETRPIHGSDIRVIATTNVQLEAVVDRGLFRSDLYYRLNVIPLTLPPLHERLEDLPLLAEHFARNFAQKQGQRAVRLHPEFLGRLATYHWPGNVRELANFMQRVLSLHPGMELTAECFDSEHRPPRRRFNSVRRVWCRMLRRFAAWSRRWLRAAETRCRWTSWSGRILSARWSWLRAIGHVRRRCLG